MKVCLVYFLILLSFGKVFASESEIKINVKISVLSRQGRKAFEKLPINVFYYELANKIGAVRIESGYMPRLGAGFNPILGFGRDLDGDKLIESWFLTTENGLKYFHLPSKRPDSIDAINELFSKHYSKSSLNNLESFFLSSFGFIMPVTAELYESWRLYTERLVDIKSMQVLIDRNQGVFSRDQQVFILNQIIEANQFAYADYIKAIENNNANTFRDVLIWGAGLKIAGWALQGLKNMGRSKTVKSMGTTFAQQGARAVWGKMSKSLMTSMAGMIAKVRTYSTLQGSKKLLLASAEKLGGVWKYTAMNAGFQTGVETMARMDEVYDPNPLIMAKNIMTNPNIIENVSIGAVETILMAGFMNEEKSSRLAKFLICGFISATSSIVVGEALDGGQEDSRVWLDAKLAVPEVVLMGADLWLINNLDNLVHKKYGINGIVRNGKRVKLLGYSAVMAMTAVGYYGYSKMTDAVSDADLARSRVMLIPVFAED